MKTLHMPVVLTLVLLAASCKPKYETISPKVSAVTEAVFASGSIDPKDAYTLTSISDGFITRRLVEENDVVKDGQLLFTLDNRQQNTQVAIASTNVNYAGINANANSPQLLQIKAQIDAARVKKTTDSNTLSRFERLYTTHSVSRQDLDNARLTYESSSSSLVAAMENYRATENKLHQDLANSRQQLENVKAGNQYFNLTAVGRSKVYQIFKKQGDLVRRGEQVAQLGNPDSIVIHLDIDEGSIGKIQPGLRVLVELNTQKKKTYEARITKIYPHFNENSQSYKVEARFNEDVPGLISGTQLQANIVTGKKDNALLIPPAYVLPGNKVQVQKGDKIDTVAITTGVVSEELIEVVSGLAATDKILKLK